jgi:hypothetical protein
LTAGLADASNITTAPMNDLSTFLPVGDGSVSTIIRDPGGVTVTVHTTLEPGVYTVWLFIWNDPSGCTNEGPPRCAPANDPRDSIVYATGNVVSQSGRGDFAVHLDVGDTQNVTGGAQQAGLTNALGADIHVIVRFHGAPLPDALDDQLTMLQGGCDVTPCALVQGATHEGGTPDEDSLTLQRIESLTKRIASRSGIFVD